jgi:hypothetical protein
MHSVLGFALYRHGPRLIVGTARIAPGLAVSILSPQYRKWVIAGCVSLVIDGYPPVEIAIKIGPTPIGIGLLIGGDLQNS